MWVHDMERNIMNGHYDMFKEKGALKIQCAQLNCELHMSKCHQKQGTYCILNKLLFLRCMRTLLRRSGLQLANTIESNWPTLQHTTNL
jgi:hypothetical protein